MSVILLGDGICKPIVSGEPDALFNNATAAAAATITSTRKFFIRHSHHPTLILTSTGGVGESTSVNVKFRVFFNAGDAVPFKAVTVINLDMSTTPAGDVIPIIDPMANYPINYGFVDFQLQNADAVNDLTGVYGRLLLET